MKTIIHVCQKNHFVFINSLSRSSEVKIYIEKRKHMFTDLFLSLFSYHSHNFMAQYIENIFTIHVSEKLVHYPLKKPIFLGSLAELSCQTWLVRESLLSLFSLKLSFYRLYSSSIFLLITRHACCTTEKSFVICKSKHVWISCNWSFTEFAI